MSEPDIPRHEIAERALKKIRTVLDDWSGSDWLGSRPSREIEGVVEIADAQLRMMSLRRRRAGAHWLAKPISYVYPRQFAGEWGGDPDPHMCLQIEISDGPKTVRDRCVEIQMPDDDMERLARQMLRMVESRRNAKGEGS